MKTTQLKEILEGSVDVISKRKDIYQVKRSFFYRHGMDSDKLASNVKAAIEAKDKTVKVKLVDNGEHWHGFVGGAKSGSSQDSYFWVKFQIVPNDDIVTVKNLMSGEPVAISARDVGGPCDPSTERYWSM